MRHTPVTIINAAGLVVPRHPWSCHTIWFRLVPAQREWGLFLFAWSLSQGVAEPHHSSHWIIVLYEALHRTLVNVAKIHDYHHVYRVGEGVLGLGERR